MSEYCQNLFEFFDKIMKSNVPDRDCIYIINAFNKSDSFHEKIEI